jgi:DNA-binding MarR family transcriptional regulator
MVQPTTSSTDDLLRGLFRLMQQARQAPHDDVVERPALIVLARLKERGALRLSDLAGDVCLDVSTMSRHVRALEERGYVERTTDPADGRASLLTLTVAGRRVLATAWASRRAWVDRSLEGWSAQDRQVLTDALERFAAALSSPAAPAGRSQRQESSA